MAASVLNLAPGWYNPAMFATHLREAIAVNRARRPKYAARTNGASRWLSTGLIASELNTLPLAWWFDWRARRLGNPGVVTEDFVPMDDAALWDMPPTYTGIASDAAQCEARALLTAGRKATSRAPGDFEAVAAEMSRLLTALRDLETTEGAHFAMAVHIVESVGFAAANAPRWIAVEPRARRVSRDLVWVQAQGLLLALPIDTRAQPLHAQGIGIVVNDVPPIPFPGTDPLA